MKGFFSLLAKLFESQQNGFIKRILAGAGLTLGSTAVTTSLIQQYINNMKSGMNSLSAEILGILHLSSIDYALSVVLSAIIARAVMNGTGLTLRKK